MRNTIHHQILSFIKSKHMKNKLLFLTALLLTGLYSSAQTQFWSDDFESAGSPSSGARTSSVPLVSFPASPPHSKYFDISSGGTDLALQNAIPYAGFNGSQFFAAEDIDGAVPTGANGSQDFRQSLSWDNINITGKSGMSFKGLFACNNSGGSVWDAGPPSDYMILRYRINNGAWVDAIRFFPNASPNGSFALETTGDSIAEGAVLPNMTFTEFTATVVGTGTDLDIQMLFSSNGGLTEELAVDNFRLFETPSCTAPTITANPPNRARCASTGTTFTASATGATAFQWQENTGSGFANITNGGIYSGATTTTLTLSSVSAGMSGYQYRMVAINGVASCFTNSNSGTLTVSSINTSSASQTNVSCNSGSNGAASVSPSGGIAPYTYSWSPSGGTGAIASGLSAGSYTVTVTDNIGCQGTRNYTITQPTTLNGSTVVTNVACNGGTNGAINLTASGGTPGYTFNWGGGVTTEDRTGLAAGTYAVIITDANGCTRNVTGITVTQPTSAVSGTTVVTNVACNGGTSGAINLTPTGGTGPYTFAWGGGVTTEDRTSLAAGTYSVTITDVNACTGTVNATVTQPTSAVSGTTVVTNVACFGGSNGAINLTPTGGTGPYTFNWLPSGPTTEDRTGLIAGTYQVQVTDVNGCTGTVSATVTQPTSAVSGTTVVTNVACFGGANGAINLTPTGGTGPYTFNWLPSGPTTEDRTGLVAGTYQVQVTDVNGCTGTVTATVTQPTSAVSGTTVVTNVACFGGSNGAINLTPTGGTGPYTFNWLPSGPTTEDRTGLVAGTYQVQVTDVNGCTATVTATVTQPTSAVSGTTVVTNVACFGGANGAINLTPTGGTGPYTFNWLPSGPTTEDRTGLVAGTYQVQVTDANGCTGTVTATVTQPTSPVSGTTVVTNVACFGGNTGAINLTPTGGTGPYTFAWGGGITTEDRTSLTAGTYSVTITDVNGCTGTVNPTVTQPAAAVSGTTVVTNVACFGGNTGAINLTPTGGVGPYTFSWGGGVTTEDRTGLTAGTYSVTITDANGCTGTVSPTVTQPAATVSGTTVVTNVACFGGSNGAINLTPAGGTGPYTFNWASGPTTEDRTGLAAGSYSVTITDANGCTGTVSGITITQPTSPVSGTTVVTNVTCDGGTNGSIDLTPAGGTPGYTYNWGGGITSQDRTSLSAGTYSVTITDANGCTGTVSGITITQPSAISFTAASQTNVACFGNATGAFEVNPATGGTPGYTYDWTPGTPTGDGTTSVTGLTAGSYSVVATDANGCTATVSFTITQAPALSVTAATQTNIACNGGATGAAAINTPTGGTPGYTYDWTPGNPTGDGTVSVTGLAAGTYTVTVTDANGCVASQSFTVTEPTALSVTAATQTNIACNGGATGAAAINTPTGGTPGYTYDWAPGTPTGDGTTSVTGLTAGTYTVTVTDANGCAANQSFTVTEPTAISVTASAQTNIACNGGSNGAAEINTPTGGTPGYTYDWTPGTPTGDGTTSVTGLTAGTYTITVTDANGCTASQVFTVTQPTAISVTQDSQTNIACNGGATGAVEINPATGGAGSFTYDWAPGTPTGDGTTSVTGLTAGTYTVTVTDANGCTASQAFTVTEPTAISVTPASQTNIACNGGANGAAEINTPTGGTPGYTYDWAPGTPSGEGTTSVAGLVAGTYTVTATDNNGCTATQTFTITEPAAISITADSQTNVTCNGGSDGTASINTPTGGTPGYTYDWTPGNPTGDGTTSVSGLALGVYFVTVTDANGCTAEQLFTITEPAAITSSFTATSCDSYTWNTQTYNASGTYTQVLTSVSGCDSTVTLNLTINMSSSETLNVTECESYTLNGQTYTASGTYTQTLTNAAACDSIITLNLIINSADADTTLVTACDSYVWNGQTFTTSGFYTVAFTNANGCDSIENLDLTIVTTPVAGITSL
ncbi:MAG: gliding motility-related protein, partial [Fluviicola sp.]|nr:gliding motility-related protein [Fluviicola sp.]